MKFMPRHRRQMAVSNDTKHEWVCLSVTEKNDRATYFPNGPRTSITFEYILDDLIMLFVHLSQSYCLFSSTFSISYNGLLISEMLYQDTLLYTQ